MEWNSYPLQTGNGKFKLPHALQYGMSKIYDTGAVRRPWYAVHSAHQSRTGVALPVDAGLLAASPVTYARLAQQKF